MRLGGDKQDNKAEDGGIVYAVQGGSQTINHFLEAASRIRPYNQPDPPSREWLIEQPSRLLQATSGVLDLIGRRSELSFLLKWRDSESGAAALLLHGTGGQGKSRLAMEFAANSAAQGWEVLEGIQRDEVVANNFDPPPLSDRTPLGTLLIVDYADRWTHRELSNLYLDLARRTSRTLRILFIGRSVKWWPAMRAELDELGVDHADLKLGALGASSSEAEIVFRHAVTRYADVLSVKEPHEIKVKQRPLRQTEGLALNILSLALVAVDAHKRGKAVPANREELAAYLLDREYRNWTRLHSAGKAGQDFSTQPSTLRKVVFIAALCGELPYEGAVAALHSNRLVDAAVLLDDHRLCYPPTDRSKMLGPLYPDRLAEDFIALFLPGHDVTGFDPDPWSLSAPTRLLAAMREIGASLAVRRMITFLAASAERWPHVATYLTSLLDRDPNAAIEAGSEAILSITRNELVPIGTIDLIDAAFPSPTSYDLATAEAAVTERKASYYLPEATPWRRAEINYSLGTRLHKAGRSSEALELLENAASEFESLTKEVGDTVERNPREMRASALTNCATVLTHLGELEEALKTEKVALEVREVLANEDEQRFAGDYADTLTNLAVDYWYLGMIDEAVEASAKSVAVRRRRPSGDEDALDDLARSLSNHGMVLNSAGQKDESLAVLVEAVAIYRGLVQGNSAVYTPHFAMALGNLAAGAGDMERNEEAMRYSIEAISVLRDLDEINPGLYSRELATAVDNAGQRLHAMGQYASSRSYLIEACEIRKRLSDENPVAYESHLADSLQNLGTVVKSTSGVLEALEIWDDSLALRQRLFARAPEMHRDELVECMSLVAEARFEVGQNLAARQLLLQAISIHRPDDVPNTQRPLSDALADLASLLGVDSEPVTSIDAG